MACCTDLRQPSRAIRTLSRLFGAANDGLPWWRRRAGRAAGDQPGDGGCRAATPSCGQTTRLSRYRVIGTHAESRLRVLGTTRASVIGDARQPQELPLLTSRAQLPRIIDIERTTPQRRRTRDGGRLAPARGGSAPTRRHQRNRTKTSCRLTGYSFEKTEPCAICAQASGRASISLCAANSARCTVGGKSWISRSH